MAGPAPAASKRCPMKRCPMKRCPMMAVFRCPMMAVAAPAHAMLHAHTTAMMTRARRSAAMQQPPSRGAAAPRDCGPAAARQTCVGCFSSLACLWLVLSFLFSLSFYRFDFGVPHKIWVWTFTGLLLMAIKIRTPFFMAPKVETNKNYDLLCSWLQKPNQ